MIPRKWNSSSLHQEAACRHQMMADIYMHADLIESDIQILSHDIDVDGVDMTLICESSVVPLQLKSVVYGARTARWSVRRRIPFPKNYSLLSKAILRPDGAATEGHGGALVVQLLVLRDGKPGALWYRVATLPLIFLRSSARSAAIVQACKNCPPTIQLRQSDLTPPLTIGEALWLLLGIDARSDMTPEPQAHHENLLIVEPRRLDLARRLIGDFESAAKKRWETWRRS